MWLHLIGYTMGFVFLSFGGCENLKANSNLSKHEFLIISLSGKAVDQFQNVQFSFQELFANLAKDYCNFIGLKYNGTINGSTVEVNSVTQCPKEWLDAELCVTVNLSIPLNTSGGYELSSQHMKAVWQTHTPSQLSSLGLQEYGEIPSDSSFLILWLGATGVLIILFLVIMVLVMKTKCIENYIRQRKDIVGSSNRSWISKHHEKQLVPPLFNSEHLSTPTKNVQILGSSKNDFHCGLGIENPGYDPGLITTNNHQIPEDLIDDFDSDEETIYPPSPLSRPAQDFVRTGRKTKVIESRDELETAF